MVERHRSKLRKRIHELEQENAELREEIERLEEEMREPGLADTFADNALTLLQENVWMRRWMGEFGYTEAFEDWKKFKNPMPDAQAKSENQEEEEGG